MKQIIFLTLFTTFLFSNPIPQDEQNNTKNIEQEEDETIKAIEDFMKKYSGVTRGC